MYVLYRDIPSWYDEGITRLQISGIYNFNPPHILQTGQELKHLLNGHASIIGLSITLLLYDVHPPLYYIIISFWAQVFGNETNTLRIFSTVAVACAAILLALFPVGTKCNRLQITLVFCASPYVVFSAINARDYGLALFFVVATLFCLHKTFEDNKNINLYSFLSCFFFSMAILTHYFTILALIAPMGLLAAKIKNISRPFLFASIVTFFGSGGVIAVFASHQIGSRGAQYAGWKGFEEFKSFLFRTAEQFTAFPEVSSAHIASCLIVLFAFISLALNINNKHAKIHIFSILGFLVSTSLLFWFTDKTILHSSSRYFVFILPSVLIGVIFGLPKIEMKTIQAGVMMFFMIVLNGPYLLNAKPYIPPLNNPGRENFQNSAQILQNYDRTLIVLIGTYWNTANYFDSLQNKDRVFIIDSLETAQAVLSNIQKLDAFLISKPTGFQKNFQEYFLKQEEYFKSCGFEEKKENLWIKKADEQQCLHTPETTDNQDIPGTGKH